MLDIICKIILVFLVIIGLTELSRVFIMWLYKPNFTETITMVVTMQGHDESAEFRLKSAIEKLRWMGGPEKKRLICIDSGMDEETREIAEKICEHYPFVEICSSDQFAAQFEQKFANT